MRGVRGLGEREVDARLLEVDARDLHANAVGQAGTIGRCARRSASGGPDRAEIVPRQLGHVHEAVDVEAVQRDEDAEARDAADRAVEVLADLVTACTST